MKKLVCTSLLVVFATRLSVGAAEPGVPLRPLGEPPATHSTHRVIIRHGGGKPEMETVPFLGVETAPMGAALAAQLGLAPNTGLVVRHVVPESPAAAAVQMHDVIVKVDDQVLIEPRQLSVLIRNHQAGDEVTLAYIRAGKAGTTKLKLGQHEVPKLISNDLGGPPGGHFEFPLPPGTSAASEGDVDHVLSLLEPENRHFRVIRGPGKLPPPGPGFRASTLDKANSAMSYSDDEGSLELTVKSGQKTLVAKDAKGNSLFSGPIDTREQRDSLPAEVRQRLEKVEGMEEFDFRADENTEREFRVFRPGPATFTLPLPRPLLESNV